MVVADICGRPVQDPGQVVENGRRAIGALLCFNSLTAAQLVDVGRHGVDLRLREAATMVISAGRDDTSILIVLTVRALAPDVPISVVVRAAATGDLAAARSGARRSGAPP